MSQSKAYVAIDVHARHCVMGWRNGRGQWQGRESFETSEKELVARTTKIPAGVKIVTVEESTLAAWVARSLHPYVNEMIVCDPRHNESVHQDAFKNDGRDVEELSRLLWLGQLKGVYHPQDDTRAVFKALAMQYLDLRDTQVRLKLQLKAKYHLWGVPRVEGTLVYSPRKRERYLDVLTDASVRHQLQRLYALLDVAVKQETDAYRELLACGERYPEIAEFAKIPGVGPVGSHVFDAFIQTPDRFPDKPTLWRYCRLAVTERTSDNKPLGYRRLDSHGNPELKALSYWAWRGALHAGGNNEVKQFYRASLERTHDKTHARLNTQRKIVATMWAMWRKGEAYRPERFLSPADAAER
jgi:transposase